MREETHHRPQGGLSPLPPAKLGRSALCASSDAEDREAENANAYVDSVTTEVQNIATKICSDVTIVSSGEIRKLEEITRSLSVIRSSMKTGSENAGRLDAVLGSLSAAQATLAQRTDDGGPKKSPCGQSLAERGEALKTLNEALKKMDNKEILAEIAASASPLEKAGLTNILPPLATPALPPPPEPPAR